MGPEKHIFALISYSFYTFQAFSMCAITICCLRKSSLWELQTLKIKHVHNYVTCLSHVVIQTNKSLAEVLQNIKAWLKFSSYMRGQFQTIHDIDRKLGEQPWRNLLWLTGLKAPTNQL